MQGDNFRDWQAMPDCGTPWPEQIFSFPQPNGTETPQWVVAKPNVCWYAATHQEDDQSLGPEMAFAKTLINKGVSSRVGFVPVAYGGTNLYADWASKDGLLGLLLAQTHRAMAVTGLGGRLRGMIWVQGEGDATMSAGLTHAAMYGENMKRLVSTVRSELVAYHPMLPIITAVQAVTGRDRVLPHIAMVRRHQQELELPALLKVDMEGYEMVPANFTEMYGAAVGMQSLHITKRAMCPFGDALAEAYIARRAEVEVPFPSSEEAAAFAVAEQAVAATEQAAAATAAAVAAAAAAREKAAAKERLPPLLLLFWRS